jgi:hypothetical protein
LIAENFPNLTYSAGRIDSGSDVLGFDTAQSRDHGWGPKVMIFVDEREFEWARQEIPMLMAEKLPFRIGGYPTHFHGRVRNGTLQLTDERPINHGVTVHTITNFFSSFLGIEAEEEIS